MFARTKTYGMYCIAPHTTTTETFDCPDIDTYYKRVTQSNTSIQSKVSEIIERAQQDMKKYYDHGTRISEIAPGDFVLVKDECRQDTLVPMFRDPWPVIERRDANLYIIDPNTRVVDINRCKKAGAQTPDSPFCYRDFDPATETNVHGTCFDEREEETDEGEDGVKLRIVTT